MVNKFLIFALFIWLISPDHVYGHGAGLPQFFKINGKIPDANPLQTAGILPSSFSVAQDTSADNYLVNQNIDFVIDIEILKTVFSPNVLEKTKFSWNFGDGTQTDGFVNSHTYTKAGSYTLEINADFAQSEIPTQLVESAQINIIPDENYQLPKAVIKVNGQEFGGNPLNANLDLDLNNEISLDASQSTASSSKIIEYIWDFSDGESSSDITTTHQYKLPQYYATPTLRVKDENGFISETFATLRNSGSNEQNKSISKSAFVSITAILLLVIFSVIILRSKKY